MENKSIAVSTPEIDYFVFDSEVICRGDFFVMIGGRWFSGFGKKWAIFSQILSLSK